MPNANPNGKLIAAITSGLAGLVLIGWLAFVLVAGFADHGPNDIAEVDGQLRLVGVASGTALATIAGAFLGVVPQTLRAAHGELRPRLPKWSISGWATVAYFSGLALAVLIWTFDKNRAYSAEVIQTALATTFGFAIGALKALTTTDV